MKVTPLRTTFGASLTPASPRHPGSRSARGSFALTSPTNPLGRVYRALDHAVASLIDAAPDAEITIVSDHGSGGSSDKVLYLNRALESAGLLSFRPSAATRAASWVKDRALTLLPNWTREKVFRLADTRLSSFVESRARFGSIDFSQTVAFSDELNYFPAIHLNLKEREPHGTVIGVIPHGSSARSRPRSGASSIRGPAPP